MYYSQKGIYKSWSSEETVGAAYKWAIGSYRQSMVSNEIRNNKTHVLPFFTIHKYRAFFSTNYEPSELSQWKLLKGTSPPSVRGCLWQNMIVVWHNCDALWRNWVCFDTWFLGEIMCQTDLQQHIQTHVTHLLKLHIIQNSCQVNYLIYLFCWIWLQKQNKNGLF